MRIAFGVFLPLVAAFGWACSGPSLDVPEHGGAHLSVELEPGTSDGTVPLVFRAHLRDAPSTGIPWLFRGEVSDYHERALQRGEVPSALRERAVPVRYWRNAADCWLQPLEWLAPDDAYSLAFTGVGVVQKLLSRPGAERPARRLFPPAASPKYNVSVLCDVVDEGSWPPLTLEPGGIELDAAPGMAGQATPGCVTLQLKTRLDEPVVGPPVLSGAPFEPSPWLPPPPNVDEAPVACPSGQPFFGACLEVLDDRLRVTAVARDLLFALADPRSVALAAQAGTRSLLLGGLSPNTQLEVRGSVLSSDGSLLPLRASFTTAPPRRHVVLNEVLANPSGAEPDAEWLELVNDSARPASLSGLWLEDSGGHVALPDVELEPGELALVVAEGFRASGLDVPVPVGVRLLRVPSLGARGLSNGGEALLLVGREGVISRFPLLAAPHPGRSWARRTLDGSDDDPAGFAEQPGAGATPGAANVFED